MINYEFSKNKLRKIWDKTVDVDNQIIIKQSEEIYESKKLDYTKLNTSKVLTTLTSDWKKMDLVYYNEVFAYEVKCQVDFILLNFPLYILPYIRYNVKYKCDAVEVGEQYGFNVYYIIDDIEDDEEVSSVDKNITLQVNSFNYLDFEGGADVYMKVDLIIYNPKNYQ